MLTTPSKCSRVKMAALHGLGPGLLAVPTVEPWSTPQQEVSTGVSII